MLSPPSGKQWRWIVAAVGLAVVLVVLVIKVAPELLASTSGLGPKARAEEIGRTRTATLALLAGGIALVGAVYTARTFGLNRRGQITDRFIRGVEQLGNESLDVRVGGIYALERVAHESRSEHGPVIETLSAFIRQRSLSTSGSVWPARCPTDVLAAMVVLERRNREFDDDEVEIDLRDANLSFLRLRVGADLRGMVFSRANLSYARLSGADLSDVDLQGASLTHARLDNARLSKIQAFAADMSWAWMVGADFRAALLAGAKLHHSWLIEADLRGSFLGTYFGPDRSGEVVSYVPAMLGTDGSREQADLYGAIYDEETKWPPNLPPHHPFDPVARGARAV